MRLTQVAHQPSPAWRPTLRTRLSYLLARIRSVVLRRRNA
ncbi:hypothetical protein GCM10010329_40220 [Streptomyces spiroverticillatus]|uniref:Uncharacterized protein n=1 Tax=Streptomyces finlayi TaxID=67296 RepID=A0A918WZL9_9ACTN|nr:hypothetical protein GCM10010329_40220 [Streptomyces spiroverticillatus]GHC97990.1 hypothetical protein GCM10010334_40020 [Streptomyces finlayi]